MIELDEDLINRWLLAEELCRFHHSPAVVGGFVWSFHFVSRVAVNILIDEVLAALTTVTYDPFSCECSHTLATIDLISIWFRVWNVDSVSEKCPEVNLVFSSSVPPGCTNLA